MLTFKPKTGKPVQIRTIGDLVKQVLPVAAESDKPETAYTEVGGLKRRLVIRRLDKYANRKRVGVWFVAMVEFADGRSRTLGKLHRRSTTPRS